MRAVFVVALGLVVVACSPRNQNTENGAAPRGSANVITRQELSAGQVPSNAYDAVERLRPSFLRPRTIAGGTQNARGATAPQAYAVVYVDGVRKGGPEYLRTIPTAEVSEVRYISAIDATTRYGMNVAAGVIDVKLIGR